MSLNDYDQLQQNLRTIQLSQAPEDLESYTNSLNLSWRNPEPMERANQLFQKLGPPDHISTKSGGSVEWNNVSPFFNTKYPSKTPGTYTRLVIHDKAVPHLVPVPHLDYYYAYMHIDIPDDKVEDVRKLTESVGYDTMTKEAFARCHFTPANLTSLYLMKQIARGHKSLAHAMQEYVILIPILAKEDKMGGGLRGDSPGPWHITLTNYLFDLE